MSTVVFEWSRWFDTPAEGRGAPWFFEESSDAAVWCCALFAATTALANRAGLSPDDTGELVVRSVEAMTHVPCDASPREEADYVVDAAAAAIVELL